MTEKRMRKKLMYLIGTACMLAGCQPTVQKTNDNLTIINVENAASMLTELKVSDLGTHVRYLPLETNDSCLIGNNPQIRVLENRILVISNNTVYCFDKETGHFLNTIGHTGDDPKAYSLNLPVYNKLNGMLYFKRQPDQLQRYDLQGIYHGKVRIATPPAMPASFSFLDTMLVGHYYNSIQLHAHNRALGFFTETGEIKDTINSLLPHLPAMQVSDIESINVFKQGNAGATITRFKDGTSSIGILNSTSLWEYNNQLHFKEAFNDTIYNVSATDRIIPWGVLYFGESGLKPEQRWNNDEIDGKLLPVFILENEHTVFFQCIEGMKTCLNGIYDKESGTTRMDREENGLTDDVNSFLPFKPSTCSAQGEYAQLLESDDVLTCFDEHPETKNNQALSPLLKINEEDNPVIVIVY